MAESGEKASALMSSRLTSLVAGSAQKEAMQADGAGSLGSMNHVPAPQDWQPIVIARKSASADLLIAFVLVRHIARQQDVLEIQTEHPVAEDTAAGISDRVIRRKPAVARRA